MTAPRGLLDTSIFIAQEQDRTLEAHELPEEGFISVVTLAELRAGVLVARETDVLARRLKTLESLASIEPVPIGSDVAERWAQFRVGLYDARRRVNVNDLWIAATASSLGLPVFTQDRDFDVLAELGFVDVVRV